MEGRFMKKCITCGQEIKDDALFCPYCGTRNQGDEQGAATAQDTSVNDNQAENSSDDTVTTDEAAQNIANDPFAYNRMNLRQAQQVPPMQQYQPQQQVPPMQQYQPQQQVPPMQQMYQPQYGTANTAWQDTNDQPLSVGGWIATMIVLMIPVVNFIMLLVWAFGSGNKSRKNYCLASLIIAVVMIALIMVFYIAFGLSAASAFNTMYY
jgi:uncharacterized Zn finger protein (UPF0148 family)